MHLPTILSRLAVILLGVAFVSLLPLVGRGDDEKTPGKLMKEEVVKLQQTFAGERAAVEKDGIASRFSPEWVARADALAASGRPGEPAGPRLARPRHEQAPPRRGR